MTTGNQVIVVDLSGAAAADTEQRISAATERAMTEQKSRPGRHSALRSQFLVIDSHSELERHADAYSRILLGGAEQVSLLCLVVGSPGQTAHGEPQPLIRPSLLRGSSVATIWIGDLTGRTASSGRWLQRDPHEETTALTVLVDILARDNVFAEAVRLIGELPQRVAAISIRAVRYELAPDDFRDAQNQALGALRGDQVDPGAADAVVAPPGWLVDMLDPGRRRASTPPLAAGGRLDNARNDCLDRLEDAHDGAAELRRAATLLRGNGAFDPGRIVAVGTALEEYRARVIDALQDEDLTFGLPPQRTDAMATHGLALQSGPAEIDQPSPDLLAYALAFLAAGWPLRAVSERLRRQAARLSPTGSAERVRRAEEQCPPDLIARLTDPPLFDVGASRWSRLGATALAGFLAVLWPLVGVVPGFLVVAIAVAGTRRARAAQPGDGRPPVDGQVRRQAVSGVLGVALGALVGAGMVVPPPPAWAAVAGVVAAIVLVAVATIRHWQRSVDQWLARITLTAAEDAVGGLDQVIMNAAAEDWYQADRRVDMADLLGLMANLFVTADAAVDGLAPVGVRRAGTGRYNIAGLVSVQRDPAWLVRQRQVVGRGMDSAVRTRLVDVVSAAMEDVCGTVEIHTDDLTTVDYQQFEQVLRARLKAELEHAGEAALGPDPRRGRAEAFMPADGLDDPVPLTDRGQGLFLARDPNRFREIYLVPPTLRQQVGRGSWGAQTPGARLETHGYLGVLRLQPFQAGAVATVRPQVAVATEESQ